MKNLTNFAALLGLAVCFQVAAADVTVITNAKAEFGELSKQQVSDIFLGKVKTFPDGRLAIALDQSEGSADRDEFYNKVTGKSETQLKAYWTRQVFSGKGTAPKDVPTAKDAKKLVADNPNMITYINKSLVDNSVKVIHTP